MFFCAKKNRKQLRRLSGTSVLEVIMSVAIFGVIAAGVLGLVWEPLSTVGAAENRGRAVLLAQEGLDAVRSIRNRDWSELAEGDYGLEQLDGEWQLSGSSDSSDIFTRTVNISAISRDNSGDIVISGGTVDQRTKQIKVTVTWESLLGAAKSLQLTTYLTNWNVFDWQQTDDIDFGGGSTGGTSIIGVGTIAHIELASDTPAEIWTLLDRVEDKKIFSVDGAAEDDVWAGGEAGNLYRYDGSSWAKVTAPTSNDIFGISAVSTSDVHLVGKDKQAYRWNGTSWSLSGGPFAQELNSVSMISSSFGAAVGKSGMIIHWDGSSWSVVSTPVGDDLFGVSMLSETDGFAVGNGGTVLRWDGSVWSEVAFPTGDKLLAVDYYSASLAFAGSDQNNIYRWNGTSWLQESVPTTKKIFAIAVWSSTEAWAAGESGTILEWDGSSWTQYTSPTGDHLRAITPRGPTDGWICGEHGRQLRYNPSDLFVSSGNFISSILDTDSVLSRFGLISWTETLPAGTDITLATRTGNVTTPDGTWSSWSTEITDATGVAVSSPDARYIQYRASLSTSDLYATPQLHDVTITYNQ